LLDALAGYGLLDWNIRHPSTSTIQAPALINFGKQSIVRTIACPRTLTFLIPVECLKKPAQKPQIGLQGFQQKPGNPRLNSKLLGAAFEF